MIKLDNIKKDYYVQGRAIPALKGISIEFSANEFVCILGPSGCGKTTLMNIIGGLDKASSGDLFFNGISTKRFRDTDWDNYRNKKIGFVFQSYNLIPHTSILANVELALTLSGISPTERRARAKEALDKVGLGAEYNKRPNQLSGGQMQRVAIARAIVNSPEVLLLDEPTGALDTQTSVQILDLIKQIAKDKLVIMVTHNAELAERYGSRVIHLLDGLLVSDSNSSVAKVKIIDSAKLAPRKGRILRSSKNKTAMSFFTALRLSLANLLTKKGRTIMTAFAGSIGIIGIALILSLSNGMSIYIDKMQTDTLAGYPITITSTAIDVAQAMKIVRQQAGVRPDFERFPIARKVFSEKMIDITDVISRNNITSEYLEFIEKNLDRSAYNDIIYKTGLSLRVYGIKEGRDSYTKIETEGNSFVPLGGGVTWQMLLKDDFLVSQYDVLAGNMPVNKNEIVLIVNEGNQLFDFTLSALGLKRAISTKEIPFEDIIGKEYKIVTNDELYTFVEDKFAEKSINNINFEGAATLVISGILRINEQTTTGTLMQGIGYTKELYNWLQTENMTSEIVEWMASNPDKNPNTGDTLNNGESLLRSLGGIGTPNEINIYPTDFAAKNIIKATLDAYNQQGGDKIVYTDMSEIMGDMLSTFINIISLVLIAFTAISLIVSSIMISIITYVSVLERTKEIGILRAIGARKIDVSRVFNAETFIIGLVSGIVGVSFVLLLSLPINMLTSKYLDVERLAVLGPLYSLILILISIGLTILAGLLPARGAAKKDPVLALRSE